MSRSRTSRIEHLFHHQSLALCHTYFRGDDAAATAATIGVSMSVCVDDSTPPANTQI